MSPRLSLLLCAVLLPAAPAQMAAPPAQVSRVAFGSCAKQDKPQPIWAAISEQKPDVFVFVGDNIYGDSDDVDVLRKKYAQLGEIEGFAKLRAACPVLATWDDHDFGRNDAGADYPSKLASQQAMLDFFGEPADSPRRKQEGVYAAYEFGPAERRVQLILLDTRYHRSPLTKAEKSDLPPPGSGRPGPYIANTAADATILGDRQWRWLEEQLMRPARVRLIASSIQVVAEEHGYEKWMNFPAERGRLLALISKTRAEGVIFLSGDRHSAELSRLTAERGSDGPGHYPLYDLTASALNQPRGFQNELNRWRVGTVYFQPNFGLITIDWETPMPTVRLEIRDEKGACVIRHDLALAELRFDSHAAAKRE